MAEEKRSEVVKLLDIVEDLEQFESILHVYKLAKGGIDRVIQEGIDLLAVLNRSHGMVDIEELAIRAYYGTVKAFCDKMEVMHYYQLLKIRNEYRNSLPRLWS